MPAEEQGKYKEYEALRDEILQWQNMRVNIVAGSIAFFVGVLSWFASKDPSPLIGKCHQLCCLF
jgi:hypothetical protein